MEALKIILGIGQPITDHILIWDGLPHDFETVAVEAVPDCEICGDA